MHGILKVPYRPFPSPLPADGPAVWARLHRRNKAREGTAVGYRVRSRYAHASSRSTIRWQTEKGRKKERKEERKERRSGHDPLVHACSGRRPPPPPPTARRRSVRRAKGGAAARWRRERDRAREPTTTTTTTTITTTTTTTPTPTMTMTTADDNGKDTRQSPVRDRSPPPPPPSSPSGRRWLQDSRNAGGAGAAS